MLKTQMAGLPFIVRHLVITYQWLNFLLSMELAFSYDLKSAPNDDSLVYGYATLGGFPEADRSSSQLQEQSGTFALPWIASEEEGEGELYIVLENGERGTGIWFSSAIQTE